jgi:hypothetical protein
VAGENLVLGARQVVLGQQADGLEELRAEFIVKIFREEELWTRGEAAAHVLGEVVARALGRETDEAQALLFLLRVARW